MGSTPITRIMVPIHSLTSVLPSVVVCLSVTIRANDPQIEESVIGIISVDMIQL